MASGKVHSAASVALALGLAVSDVGRWPVVGALAGVLLSPDLDVDAGYIGFGLLRKVPVVGPLLSWSWRAYWWPYTIIVPHRSVWSHGPVIGTALRALYLGVPIYLIAPFVPDERLVGALAGLLAADLLHLILDVIPWRNNE